MLVTEKHAEASDVLRLKSLVKDNWSLCNFYGKSEAEMMIAQTIHAAVINFKDHGEPFSFRGHGVFTSHGNGLFNNRQAYASLIKDGMFVEEVRGEQVVIFPTQALINKLDEFFAKKAMTNHERFSTSKPTILSCPACQDTGWKNKGSERCHCQD